ncbi:hypothetical protein [Paenibacillus sp. SI8]|uniref:hypothetical protein n=1 Tax=unclassified Paenibacillus TaxID=185978 RepID=UPI0034651DF2
MKTWEMIRSIREGETYETVTDACYFVTKRDGHLCFRDDLVAQMTAQLLSKEWRKRQPPVDFMEAFAAYEEGARITSQVTGESFKLRDEGDLFEDCEIRGKWTIVKEAQYDEN